jgi:hypothetical protein
MTKKPTSLSDVMARKVSAVTPEPEVKDGETRTITMRLKPVVHDQLREMAFTSRKSQHSLLLEALNDLFQKHGKPPIAL